METRLSFAGLRLKDWFLFRKAKGVRLSPAVLPKIGIKIETSCAPGLQVSPVLVDALLLFLEGRGYRNGQVFVADHNLMALRSAGFAKGSGPPRFFKGYPLFCSEDKSYFNSDWYHDSPLPPTPQDRVRFFLRYPKDREKRLIEERKSYLPSRLFLGEVHWINLAVAMDSLNLAIDGAAANFSLGGSTMLRDFWRNQRWLLRPLPKYSPFLRFGKNGSFQSST